MPKVHHLQNHFWKRGKKATLSLSVEFLVVIILSIVIFSMGVYFLYHLLGQAEEIKGDLDQRTEEELKRLLVDQGKRVALPLHTADISPGERHVFGLGILNVDVPEPYNQFTLSIEKVKVVDPSGTTLPLTLTDVQSWLLYEKTPIIIQQSEHRLEPILVIIPDDAAKGTYIFDVLVKKGDGNLYGNVQKFIVVVK